MLPHIVRLFLHRHHQQLSHAGPRSQSARPHRRPHSSGIGAILQHNRQGNYITTDVFHNPELILNNPFLDNKSYSIVD